MRGLRRYPEVLLRLTTYRALAWKFLGSGDGRLDDEEILTLMQRDQLKEPFTDMCLETLLKAVGEKFGYARSYNLLRAYNLVPLPAVTAEHDEEIFRAEANKGFRPKDDEHLFQLEVNYLPVAIGLQSELKAVCSRTSRKTRCPPTYDHDAKEWVARTSHWAEGARAWTFLPPREKQAAVDCDFTIGEAPIDYHAWGPFISQDKGVLNDDFGSVFESVEALH